MRLIVGLVAALVGSLLGSALSGGMETIRARHAGEPEPVINVSVSPSAAIAGATVGLVLGLRTAFWVGALVAAAGSARVDAILLRRVGIDMDELIARATAGQDEGPV